MGAALPALVGSTLWRRAAISGSFISPEALAGAMIGEDRQLDVAATLILFAGGTFERHRNAITADNLHAGPSFSVAKLKPNIFDIFG